MVIRLAARRMTCAILFAILSTAVQGVRRLPDEPEPPFHGRRLTSHFDELREQESFPGSSRVTATSDDPDSHLVTSLPLLPEGSFPTRHWAGHLPAAGDGSDKKIFYWLFEPSSGSKSDDDTPLILWLNGGPGCSSMDGLWLENGPFRLKPQGGEWSIDVNEFSWHNAPAWTLYVDQPVGTGLSFTRKGNYCKNDFEVNRDFHYFLEEFLLFHSDKFLDPLTPSENSPATSILRRPFYFSGESHAGHYIPSMMHFILQRNDGVLVPDASNGLQALRVKIPCSGAAIGNGWTDPYYQYSAADAAYGAGLIGISQRASLEEKEHKCQSNLKSGNYESSVCFQLLDTVTQQSHGRNGDTVVSSYDTRLWEKRGAARSFPLGHKDVETYLGGAKSYASPPLVIDHRTVLDAIHATESIDARQTYQECTDPPYYALQHQDGLGVVDELVQILDHESRPHMLFFNGMNDLICNHVGNERFLDALPWSRADKYILESRHAWDSGVDPTTKNNYVSGRPDGFIKQYENLSFLKILESGHMVPMDQPSIALAMIKTLVSTSGVSREGFLSSVQGLDSADAKKGANMCLLDECPDCKPELTFETESTISRFNGGASVIVLSASLVGAFALGMLVAWLIHCKKAKTERHHRELVANLSDGSDLELSDIDSISYRDKVTDAEYS
ncbi:hypothetical protein HJC23_004177 [Cyclotella cryptica]|uniref:Uncharacterized protein n=1 Tax=Cyclotella cryptica TaxID=29204 RepID=A0ABD3QDW8_9STRA|eukprot:CCRYP_007805-RA/>CCRYP_007805-RA protein AED:0.01 eAED:0.01 QI:34/1/0.5/1/1/1/2/0/671